jgi:LPXTG-site transpeptidase (sortase) family protein
MDIKHFKKSRSWTSFLSNILIFVGLLILVGIYYPIALVYLQPPGVLTPVYASDDQYYLSIPKIRAQAPIVLNVDPFNPNEYHQALTQGVAQAKGTSLPGQPGTSYIFAHSSDAPWRLARYNTVFLRLSELKNGDSIEIKKGDQTFTYTVFDKKELWPDQTQYLKDTKPDQLILQTCTPLGTSLKRLLVFARPNPPQ